MSVEKSLNITGLTNGTQYRVRVKAVHADNTFEVSNVVTGTPMTTATAPTVDKLVVGDKQATLHFSPPSYNGGAAVTNYEYSVRVPSALPANLTATTFDKTNANGNFSLEGPTAYTSGDVVDDSDTPFGDQTVIQSFKFQDAGGALLAAAPSLFFTNDGMHLDFDFKVEALPGADALDLGETKKFALFNFGETGTDGKNATIRGWLVAGKDAQNQVTVQLNIEMFVDDTVTNYTRTIAKQLVSTHAWHHVHLRGSNTTPGRCYIDGVCNTYTTITENLTPDGDVSQVGAWYKIVTQAHEEYNQTTPTHYRDAFTGELVPPLSDEEKAAALATGYLGCSDQVPAPNTPAFWGCYNFRNFPRQIKRNQPYPVGSSAAVGEGTAGEFSLSSLVLNNVPTSALAFTIGKGFSPYGQLPTFVDFTGKIANVRWDNEAQESLDQYTIDLPAADLTSLSSTKSLLIPSTVTSTSLAVAKHRVGTVTNSSASPYSGGTSFALNGSGSYIEHNQLTASDFALTNGCTFQLQFYIDSIPSGAGNVAVGLFNFGVSELYAPVGAGYAGAIIQGWLDVRNPTTPSGTYLWVTMLDARTGDFALLAHQKVTLTSWHSLKIVVAPPADGKLDGRCYIDGVCNQYTTQEEFYNPNDYTTSVTPWYASYVPVSHTYSQTAPASYWNPVTQSWVGGVGGGIVADGTVNQILLRGSSVPVGASAPDGVPGEFNNIPNWWYVAATTAAAPITFGAPFALGTETLSPLIGKLFRPRWVTASFYTLPDYSAGTATPPTFIATPTDPLTDVAGSYAVRFLLRAELIETAAAGSKRLRLNSVNPVTHTWAPAAFSVDNDRWRLTYFTSAGQPNVRYRLLSAPTLDASKYSVLLGGFTADTNGDYTVPVDINVSATTSSVALTPKAAGTLPLTGTLDWQKRLPASVTSPLAIAGLLNGVNYGVALRAVTAAGGGAAVNSAIFTPAALPGAPTITEINTVGPVGTFTVNALFKIPTDGGVAIQDYYVSVNGGTTYSLVSNTPGMTLVPHDSTTKTLTLTDAAGLVYGASYSLKLRAVNAVGQGTASDSVRFDVVLPPGTPTILTCTPSNGQLSIEFLPDFTYGVGLPTNYEYAVRPRWQPAVWSTRSPVSISSPLVVKNLTNGQVYDVSIRPLNTGGRGPAVTFSGAIGDTTPKTVPSTITLNSIKRWDAGSSLTTIGIQLDPPPYNGGDPITEYQYSTNGGTSWKVIVGGSPYFYISTLSTYTPSTTNYALLPAGITSFKFRAVNSMGAGPVSPVVGLKPGGVQFKFAENDSTSFSGDYAYQVNGDLTLVDASITYSWFDYAGDFTVPSVTVELYPITQGEVAVAALFNQSTGELTGAPAALETLLASVSVNTQTISFGTVDNYINGDSSHYITNVAGGAITLEDDSTHYNLPWHVNLPASAGAFTAGVPYVLRKRYDTYVPTTGSNTAGLTRVSQYRYFKASAAPAAPIFVVHTLNTHALTIQVRPGAATDLGGGYIYRGTYANGSPITAYRFRIKLTSGGGYIIDQTVSVTAPNSSNASYAYTAPTDATTLLPDQTTLEATLPYGGLFTDYPNTDFAQFIFKGLTNGTSYTIEVLAQNSLGWGSVGSHTATPVAAPLTPTIAVVSRAAVDPAAPESTTSLRVSVSGYPDLNSTGGVPLSSYDYEIYVGDTGVYVTSGTQGFVSSSLPNPFYITDTSINHYLGQSLKIRVCAKNSANLTSDWSSLVSVLSYARPYDLTASSVANSILNLTVPGVTPATVLAFRLLDQSFDFIQSIESGGAPITKLSFKIHNISANTDTYQLFNVSTFENGFNHQTDFSLTGLIKGTKYNVSVAAVNAQNAVGPYSVFLNDTQTATAVFRPLAAPKPPVFQLPAESRTFQNVYLQSGAVGTLTGYLVFLQLTDLGGIPLSEDQSYSNGQVELVKWYVADAASPTIAAGGGYASSGFARLTSGSGTGNYKFVLPIDNNLMQLGKTCYVTLSVVTPAGEAYSAPAKLTVARSPKAPVLVTKPGDTPTVVYTHGGRVPVIVGKPDITSSGGFPIEKYFVTFAWAGQNLRYEYPATAATELEDILTLPIYEDAATPYEPYPGFAEISQAWKPGGTWSLYAVNSAGLVSPPLVINYKNGDSYYDGLVRDLYANAGSGGPGTAYNTLRSQITTNRHEPPVLVISNIEASATIVGALDVEFAPNALYIPDNEAWGDPAGSRFTRTEVYNVEYEYIEYDANQKYIGSSNGWHPLPVRYSFRTDKISTHKITIPGLKAASVYEVRLRAVNAKYGARTSVNSSDFKLSRTLIPPGIPTITKISPVAGTATVEFSLTRPPFSVGIARYEYTLDGGTTYKPVCDKLYNYAGVYQPTDCATKSPITIRGLANGATYALQIRTFGYQVVTGTDSVTEVRGDWSLPSTFTLPATAPDAPNLLAITVDDKKLVLTFKPGVDNGKPITNYEYSTALGAGFSKIELTSLVPLTDGKYSVTITQSTATPISNLVNGTSYAVRLRAVNSIGAGSSSTPLTAVPLALPTAPVLVSAKPDGAGFLLNFTPPVDFGGSSLARYEYSSDNQRSWAPFNPARLTSPSYIYTPSQDAATALRAFNYSTDNEYSITLRAVNNRGPGAVSNTITLKHEVPGQAIIATPWISPDAPPVVRPLYDSFTGEAYLRTYIDPTLGPAATTGVPEFGRFDVTFGTSSALNNYWPQMTLSDRKYYDAFSIKSYRNLNRSAVSSNVAYGLAAVPSSLAKILYNTYPVAVRTVSSHNTPGQISPFVDVVPAPWMPVPPTVDASAPGRNKAAELLIIPPTQGTYPDTLGITLTDPNRDWTHVRSRNLATDASGLGFAGEQALRFTLTIGQQAVTDGEMTCTCYSKTAKVYRGASTGTGTIEYVYAVGNRTIDVSGLTVTQDKELGMAVFNYPPGSFSGLFTSTAVSVQYQKAAAGSTTYDAGNPNTWPTGLKNAYKAYNTALGKWAKWQSLFPYGPTPAWAASYNNAQSLFNAAEFNFNQAFSGQFVDHVNTVVERQLLADSTFTLELKFKATSFPGSPGTTAAACLFVEGSYDPVNNVYPSFVMTLWSTGEVRISVSSNGTSPDVLNDQVVGAISLDMWQEITVIRSKDALVVYQNGFKSFQVAMSDDSWYKPASNTPAPIWAVGSSNEPRGTALKLVGAVAACNIYLEAEVISEVIPSSLIRQYPVKQQGTPYLAPYNFVNRYPLYNYPFNFYSLQYQIGNGSWKTVTPVNVTTELQARPFKSVLVSPSVVDTSTGPTFISLNWRTPDNQYVSNLPVSAGQPIRVILDDGFNNGTTYSARFRWAWLSGTKQLFGAVSEPITFTPAATYPMSAPNVTSLKKVSRKVGNVTTYKAEVTLVAPADDGGSAITDYECCFVYGTLADTFDINGNWLFNNVPVDGNQLGPFGVGFPISHKPFTSAGSTAVAFELPAINGSPVAFIKVRAVNALGTGPASAIYRATWT